jgi:hypothetical protein
MRGTVLVAAMLAGVAGLSATVLANGGPFLVKYPAGDPAAKGILARVDRSLKPAGEEQLEVVSEDLTIRFVPDHLYGATPDADPVGEVTATYRIRNPTSAAIQRDFGFPILRGIYMSPFAMMPVPDVNVSVDGTNVQARVISNSGIYGVIRGRARETIEAGIANDDALKAKMAALAGGGEAARDALEKYMSGGKKWSASEAALFVEYASLVHTAPTTGVARASRGWGQDWYERDPGLVAAKQEAAQAVRMIGELKATQWLSLIAGKFNPVASSAYEDIFSAWGGDIRETSVDVATGKTRPREFTVSTQKNDRVTWRGAFGDPTVYARVDYLGPTNGLSEAEVGRWRRVLKELPVVFTFAPMNLLYYQANFPAGSERTVTVFYRQYPFHDTRGEESYQLAYVVHPASLWKSFGPINLSVHAPKGVNLAASVALGGESGDEQAASAPSGKLVTTVVPTTCRRTVLADKKGELLVGLRKSEWKQAMAAVAKKADTARK